MDRTPEPTPDGEADELARARDVLERTMRFLARCAEDPQAALASEDPQQLIQGLQSLGVSRPAPTTAEDAEPRTIQIRRRRSA